MPNNSDNIGKLYNNLRSAGYDDIGTEQEFRDYVSDENNVKSLHAALEDAGYDDIGSEQEFSEWLRPKQAAPQEQPQQAASSRTAQQSEQPQQGNTSLLEEVGEGIDNALKAIKEKARPDNFMAVVNAYRQKRDREGKNAPAEIGVKGIKDNYTGLISKAADLLGIGKGKQQDEQPEQPADDQQAERVEKGEGQTQYYYNQLKDLYDKKVKAGTESAYRQLYNLGSGDEGDYGVIITPKGGTYNDEGLSVVNTRDAQGRTQTEARLGTGRRDAALAEAVDMFAHDKAREEADILLKNVSDGVDPETAFDELKAGYYTDTEQNRLWSIASRIGIPYDEFIENYMRPAINESAKQTHNGLTFPVGQLTSDWGKVGEQDKEYDTSALNMSEKTIYNYLLNAFDKELSKSKAQGGKAAEAVMNSYDKLGTANASRFSAGLNAYRTYNQYADPQKAIDYVIDKLYNGSSNLNTDEGPKDGKGKGKEKVKKEEININKQAIGKLLYRRIVDKLVSERIPKSKWGYVLKGFMDSDLGSMLKAASETPFQRHLDELADSKYSRSLKGFEGMLATGGHEALKFIADSWEYYLGGKVGNFAAGAMRSRAVRQMTEDLVMRGVKENTARGIAVRVLSSTAQTALQKGKQAAVHGAATMATASTISGSLRQGLSPAAGAKLDEIEERRASGETISKKQEQQELAAANSKAHNIFNVLGAGIKEGASGAVSGLAFGPGAAIGDAVSKLTGRYMGSLVSSAAGYLSKLGTNATSMTALSQLEGSITGQRPEGSIANQFMQNLVTFAMMDAQGKMNSLSLHPFRDARSRREAEYKHIISDEDQKRMRDAGYGSLLDSIDKLGTHGNDTYEDMGVNYKMMQFLGDKSLPEELKAKYYRVITGRDMPLSPVTGSEVTHDEKGYYVITYNPNGDVVSDHRYRTKAEADKMNAEYLKDAEKNTLKVLEDTVSDADFLDDLDVEEQYAREYADRDSKIYEKIRDGETDYEKDILFVTDNRKALGEAIRKYKSGVELTDAEQTLLEALVRVHTKIKETRIKSMRKNVERDNNLSEGGLQQAIDGHESKEEAQKLAGEGEQVYKSADGKWRTNDEIGALDGYRMQLEDMLREKAGSSEGPQTGEGQQGNDGTQPQAEEGNKIGENRGLPYEPTEFEKRTNNSVDTGKRIIGNGDMMIGAAGFADRRQRALSDFGAVFDGNGKDAEKVRQLATILDSHDSEAMQKWLNDNAGNLSDEQRDAVLALWDCANVENGVQQQIETLAGEAGEKERKDCEQYVGSDGNITTLTTKDGGNYFYLSGDMSDIDGSIIVVDAEGVRKQIYVSDISSKGEPVSLEQHITDVQNLLRQKLQNEYNDIANGRTLQPGMEADVIINGSRMHIKCTAEDENGVTAELPDGSTYTFSHDELGTAINGARQQRAAAEAEAAAQAKAAKEREERFKNDIAGYADGSPDLSAPETKAKTAAEYLQYLEQQGQSHDDIKQRLRNKVLEYANKADGVSEKISKLKSEYSILDPESEGAKGKEKEIEEAEQELRGLKSRAVKEARLRNEFLAEDERSQEAQERQTKIRDIEGKLPEDNNTPDVTLPDISKGALIGNYESKEDAAQYLDSEKEKLRQRFNEARDNYDDSDRKIREYQNGEYPYTDEELSNALAKRSKAKAEMDAISQAVKDIDKVKKTLPLIYKDVSVKEPEDIDWHSISDRKTLLKTAKKLFGADWDYDESQEQTPEAIVAQELPAHSLLASDMMHELGVTWGDLKHLSYYFGNPNEERTYNRKLMTVKAAAEYCLSDIRDMLGDTIDEQDIRNTILEMFRSASKPSDIYNYDIYDYIDKLLEQRAAEREAERQAKEEDEEYQSYLEGNGAQLADAQDVGSILADAAEREKEYGKQMEEAQKQIDELKKQAADDEQKKKAEEEAQRKKQEALDKLIKENEEKLKKLKEEQEKAKKAEESGRKSKEEALRKAEEEKKRKAQEAADKKADEEKREAARQAYEKAYRAAMERQRQRKEQQAEAERQRKAEEEAEEAARKAAEEAEKKAKEEAARKEAEEKAKAERERKAKEEAERKAAEAAREAEKKEAERKMKEAAERKAKEEAGRQQKGKGKGQGKKNEGQFGLVSDERMEELKKRLREKLSQLNAGFDPELLAIGLEMTAGYVDRGIKRFADFAKQMKDDFGDKVVPYLKAFYNGARDMPEVTKNGMDKEMDKYEDVSSFDVSKIDSYKPAEKGEGKTAEQSAEEAAEKSADNKENGQQPEQQQKKEVNLDNYETDKYSITKQFNEYKGKDIWVVRIKGPRVDRSLFNRWRKWAKFYDGYWSSYKGVNGFVFSKPEKAKNFAEDEFPDTKETEQPKEPKEQQAAGEQPATEQQPSTERETDKQETEQHSRPVTLTDKALDRYVKAVEYVAEKNGVDIPEYVKKLRNVIEDAEADFSKRHNVDRPRDEGIIESEKKQIPEELEKCLQNIQETKDAISRGEWLEDAAKWVGRARALDNYIKAVEAKKTGDKVLDEAARRKEEAENTVNLSQSGDFIEAVGEDAEKLAKATGITVTDRGGQKFAGFPKSALENYLNDLKNGKYKVKLGGKELTAGNEGTGTGTGSSNESELTDKDILDAVGNGDLSNIDKLSYIDSDTADRLKNIFNEGYNTVKGSLEFKKNFNVLSEADVEKEIKYNSNKIAINKSYIKPGKNAIATEDYLIALASAAGKLKAAREFKADMENDKPEANKGNNSPSEQDKSTNLADGGKPATPQAPSEEKEKGEKDDVRGVHELRPEGLRANGNNEGEHTEGQGEEAAQDSKGNDGKGETRSVGRVQPGNGGPVRPGERVKNGRNNYAERGVDYAPKSVDARIKANIDAITTLKKILSEGREATPEEMEVLRKFSGWGGLGKAFSKPVHSFDRNETYDSLKKLLTEDELNDAEMSRNSAYYTPAPVIDSMWDIARALGFKGGNVLEGSAGIGNIIGLMPQDISRNSNIHAVEIDSVTGNILKLLYPDAKTEVQGFENTRVRNGSVDLSITNVPFVTGLRVNDTTGDKDLSNRFNNIHDFCIAKNIRKLKPGGIGIFITSSGTLDNSDSLRQWITSDGDTDVIAAFRMNNKTFGGTAATSDIIVVRRRVNGQKSPMAIDVSKVGVERVADFTDEAGKEHKVPIVYNQYFIDHPEMMGGRMYAAGEKGDTFRPDSKGLFPEDGVSQQERLENMIKGIAEKSKEAGSEQAKAADESTEESKVYEVLGPGVKEGSLVLNKNGELCTASFGEAVPIKVNKNKVKGHTKQECFNDYTRLKNAVQAVLDYETANDDDKGLEPLLKELNSAYDDFTAKYGPLNKNTAISFLKNDIDFPSIAALEPYKERNDANGKRVIDYKKSDIFNKRIVSKPEEPQPATIEDGITTSIFKKGKIDTSYIAKLLGKSETEVREQILNGGLGYENPATGDIEPAYIYLSGNVREKLDVAEGNNDDGRYDSNIKALSKVVPPTLPIHLIQPTMGSTWIDHKIYEKYIKDKTGIDVTVKNAGGQWAFDAPTFGVDSEKNRAAGVYSKIADRHILGTEIIKAALTGRTIVVSRIKWDGTVIRDAEATKMCADKASDIKEDFREYVSDYYRNNPEEGEKAEKDYNYKFNNYVKPDIPDSLIPEHFEGASHDITLRAHQAKAAMRAVTGNIMFAHEVGSGKTFTIITAAMEMRRLGTAKKPMVVVQNATVEQFIEQAKRLYPNAKILTINDKDRTKDGRRAFYAKIRYNDWDMVVIPQSVLDMIPDSDERKMDYIRKKIAEKQAVLQEIQNMDDSAATRQVNRELSNLQGQLADVSEQVARRGDSKRHAVALQNAQVNAVRQLDRRVDEDVTDFDGLGIDALFVDEAHNYKHLGFETTMRRGVKGVDPSASPKCASLYLKCQSVMERTGGKNIVFATGTPISNTAAEIWTFMKYLMPEEMMKSYGIYYFDDFAKNFGDIDNVPEFSTSGKFKDNNRFKGYNNLPELVRIWSTVSDTVLSAQVGSLQEKIPAMEGGKARDIYLPQTRALRSIMKYVRQKLEEFDNMTGREKAENSAIPLVMYGIAKKAAVDPRLVSADAPDDPNSKTNATVRETLKALKDSEKYKGTVAIFADNYKRTDTVVENGKHVNKVGFNLFDDIKNKLIEAGVPAEQIAVIGPGMDVKKKTPIFDKVNAGQIRVVLGSTETLGTGVNMQERLFTLIHIDAPNRPMDYTQRNGRILRQGNIFKQLGIPVRVLRFGVEDSLDVTAYQRLKTKGAIADSIMHGEDLLKDPMSNRTIEEEDDIFGDTVANLSGSQYALLKQQAEKELKKLQRKQKEHDNDQLYIQIKKPQLEHDISFYDKRINKYKNIIEQTSAAKEKGIEIGGKKYLSVDDMKDVFANNNKSIAATNKRIAAESKAKNGGVAEARSTLNIKINGFDFSIDTMYTAYDGGINRSMSYSCKKLGIDDITVSGGRLVTAVKDITENIVTGKDAKQYLKEEETRKAEAEKNLDYLKAREGKPFELAGKLKEMEKKVAEYDVKMRDELKDKEAKYAEMDKDLDAADLDEAVKEDTDARFQLAEENRKPADTADAGVHNAVAEQLKDSGIDVVTDKDEYNKALEHAQEGQEFKTGAGETYGFTIGGKIYLNPEHKFGETPLHEYAHLWSAALRNKNPKEWENVKNLLKNTWAWDYVKKHYPHLKTEDEIADEALSQFSGKHGAEKLKQAAEEAEGATDERTRNMRDTLEHLNGGKSNNIKERIKAGMEKVRQALSKYWNNVCDLLHVHFTTAEEVADRVTADMLNGYDPTKDMTDTDLNADVKYHKASREEAAKLDKEKTVKLYRAMQVIDGKLYPPMMAAVKGKLVEPRKLGEWEVADERPGIIKYTKVNKKGETIGYVDLDKGSRDATGKKAGKVPDVAYNPYWHSSRSPLNDQFSSAWIRPNLVTVEVEVPESELTSGYRAKYAKDPVGETDWKAGTVTKALTALGHEPRKVVLSRYDKPVRVLSNGEVADRIAEYLGDYKDKIEIPENVVTPQVAEELKKRGVRIGEPEKKYQDKKAQLKDAIAKGLTVSNELIDNDEDIMLRRGGTAKEHTAEEKSRMQQEADNLGTRLGGENITFENNGHSGIKGWYDSRDGSVHVNLDEADGIDDVKATVCHEKLGHEGLGTLFGDQQGVDAFGAFIYETADKNLRKKIVEKANENGYAWTDSKRYSKAAQEVFADMAQEGPASPSEFSLWRKVKHYIIRKCKEKGIKVQGLLNDKDMRYYVLKTGEGLKAWQRMTDEQRAEAAKTGRVMYSKRGKPRQKKGESMGDYLLRLSEYQKWKNAEKEALANNDPMPDEKKYTQDAEETYKHALSDWKRANGFAENEEIGSFPKREDGETPQDYAVRVADYEEKADKWEDAPDYFSWLKHAQDKWREDYRAWMERYDLHEQESVDEQLFEGGDGSKKEETPQDQDAQQTAEQEVAQEAGIDITPDGAKRQIRRGVIERRKNLESSNMEDAIFCHDLKKDIAAIEKKKGYKKGELAKGLVYMIERPLQASEYKNDVERWVNYINMHPDFEHLHITADDMYACTDELGEITDTYLSGGDLTDVCGRLAQKLNDMHKGDAPIDRTDLRKFGKHLANIAKAMQDERRILDEIDSDDPEIKQLLQKVHDWYDNFYHLLEDAGLKYDETGYISNGYVNHVWDRDKSDPQALKIVENIQRTTSSNMKKRQILTYADGEALGLVPKFDDISKIMAYYSAQNNEAIANRKFLDDLNGYTITYTDDAGNDIAQLPMITTDKPAGDVMQYYHQDPYHVAGVGDIYVLNDVRAGVRSVFGNLRTTGVDDWVHTAGHAWDVVGGVQKKIQLSLSAFHMGALSEVAIAQMINHPVRLARTYWKIIPEELRPVTLLKNVFRGQFLDSLRNSEIPAYNNPEDAKFAAKHLVQLGATQDYAAADVNMVTEKFRELVKQMAKEQGIKGVAGTALTPLAVMLDWVNKGIDRVLWNYLHDGLKIFCFKSMAADAQKFAAKHDMSPQQVERLLDEVGQYTNDTFGGQYWELLDLSPATVKWLRRALLSPDWLVSTQRHFFSNFGFGRLYDPRGFCEYAKQKTGAEEEPEDMKEYDLYRQFRSHQARICYCLGVGLFFYTIMNGLNALFRWKDEKEQQREAEEMRRKIPDYKSPYELAYPDGMKWYDYTMLGNSLGQQTHLYWGRYQDGTETYVRWGKQFREFPEMFLGPKGFDFPGAMIQRMMGKSNPNIGLIRDNLGALGIWGFSNDYSNQEIQNKYGRTIGLLAKNAQHFLPFSVPTRAEKEFKLVDLIMPSAKGFSRFKAVDYFTDFIKAGDMEGVVRTYNAAAMNKIDAEQCLNAAIQTVKAEQRDEMKDGITDLQKAMNAFDNATTTQQKKLMRNKIIKYLAAQNYDAFTREEALQMIRDYQTGDNVTEKAGDKYINMCTAADIRDDYRFSAAGKQAKKYVDKLKDARNKRDTRTYNKLVQRYRAWIEVDKVCSKERTDINKLKNMLGKGHDRDVLKKMRETRAKYRNVLDNVQPPRQ